MATANLFETTIRVRLPPRKYHSKKPQIKDTLTIYFQKSHVSGGCEVEDVNVILEDDSGLWITVTFTEPFGVKKVLEKQQHQLLIDEVVIPIEVCAHVLPISLAPLTPEDSSCDSFLQSFGQFYEDGEHAFETDETHAGEVTHEEKDEEELMVEVTEFEPGISEELLRLYFESPRKSGGGEIRTWERDPKTGTVIRFTYKDESVTRSVTSRAHKLNNVVLSVTLTMKKPPRPRPVKRRCLILSGIPDGCTTEHLTLFLENRSHLDLSTIQYGEKPGTAICTFSSEIHDLEKLVQQICSKKLQGVFVNAEKVHETDCILVQGFSASTTLDLIELYFDNEKRSGGGGVREVEQGPEDGQAVVYFQDWKVVDKVLTRNKTHIIQKQNLTVEEYHNNLGRLSQIDSPTLLIPKPVSVPVQENIMAFIFGKGLDMKTRLSEELKRANGVVQWPDGDVKTARIEPIVQDGQRQSSWHGWSDTVVRILQEFLGRCKTTRIAIPQLVWVDVINKVGQLNSRWYTVEENSQRHIVHLVGEQQAVDTGEAEIKGIIREKKGQAEYDTKQMKKEVALQPLKFQQFTYCRIKETVKQDFSDIDITTSTKGDQTYLCLEGIRKRVEEAELSMQRQMDELKEITINVGTTKVLFIQSISDKLQYKLQSKGIHVAFTRVGRDSTIIYGPTEAHIEQAKEYLDRKIEEELIPVKTPEALLALQSHHGTQLLRNISEKDFVAANMTHAKDGVAIVGFKSELKEAKLEITEFLKSSVVTKECIRMSKTKVYSIVKNYGEELDKFEKQNDHHHVKISTSGKTGEFVIEGNQDGLEKARQFINSLMSKAEDEQSPSSDEADSSGQYARHGSSLIGRLFSGSGNKKDMGAQMQPRGPRKMRKHASVRDHTSANQSYLPVDKSPQNVFLHTPVQNLPTPPVFVQSAPTLNRSIAMSANDSRYVTNEGINLIVCKGDITRQQVNAIVSPTDSTLKSRGGVAKAIASAAGVPLEKHCMDLIKRRNLALLETECILTPGFNLKCLIIHAVGPGGHDMSNSNNRQKLSDTFRNCLQMAEENEIPCLAIPLIGSGSAGGSKDACADSLVSAILDFSLQSCKFVRNVYLVNIDNESCIAINRALSSRGVGAIQSFP